MKANKPGQYCLVVGNLYCFKILTDKLLYSKSLLWSKCKCKCECVCLNVNVYVYSLISHRVQQTSQFTPLVLELSLVQSHLLWGEFSAFSAAIAIHNSPLFVPPGTHHCWVDRGGMIWKACPTPLHMANSVTRAPAVTHPSTNRARRCLTSVIWRELVRTRPCATVDRFDVIIDTMNSRMIQCLSRTDSMECTKGILCKFAICTAPMTFKVLVSLSDMKWTVMIWRSWVRTPVGLNLGCIVLLSRVVLDPKILKT